MKGFFQLPLATATFDANSVKTWANKQIRNSKRIKFTSLRLANDLPSIDAIPDWVPPFAKANPPPNKKIKLHGMFVLMYFHVIKLGVVALGNLSGLAPQQNFNQSQLAGNMNNAITMKIAGVASPILILVLSTNNSDHPVKNPIAWEKKSRWNLCACVLLGVQVTWFTQKEQCNGEQKQNGNLEKDYVAKW